MNCTVQGHFSENGALFPYHDHQLLYQSKRDDSFESEILQPALYKGTPLSNQARRKRKVLSFYV